jgi:hypothetical protein
MESAATEAELDGIKLDLHCMEITLAIRDALKPPAGEEQRDCFVELGKKGLKLIFKNRFEWKQELCRDEIKKKAASQPAPASDANPSFKSSDAADAIYWTLKKYWWFPREWQYAVVTLYVLYTYFFEEFPKAPRLVLTSAMRGCGKSNLMQALSHWVARAYLTMAPTYAELAFRIDAERRTAMIDRNKIQDSELAGVTKVASDGYDPHGSRDKMVGKEPKQQRLFGPMVLSLLWSSFLKLPDDIPSRCFIVMLKRCSPKKRKELELKKFKITSPEVIEDLNEVLVHVQQFEAKVNNNEIPLITEPDMPSELLEREGRIDDNANTLLSMADTSGGDWPTRARKALIDWANESDDQDESIPVGLHAIRHTWEIIQDRRLLVEDEHRNPWITNEILTKALQSLDSAEGMWTNYRGPDGDKPARRLTKHSLAALVKPYDLRSQQFWEFPRSANKSRRGYSVAGIKEAVETWLDLDENAIPSETKAPKPQLRIVDQRKTGTENGG